MYIIYNIAYIYNIILYIIVAYIYSIYYIYICKIWFIIDAIETFGARNLDECIVPDRKNRQCKQINSKIPSIQKGLKTGSKQIWSLENHITLQIFNTIMSWIHTKCIISHRKPEKVNKQTRVSWKCIEIQKMCRNKFEKCWKSYNCSHFFATWFPECADFQKMKNEPKK